MSNLDEAVQGTQNGIDSETGTATEQLLSTWRKQVQTDNLAQHTTWRRMLYFYDDQNRIFAKKQTESMVDDSSFFLSKRGQQDAAAELDATLLAIYCIC